MPYVTFIPMKTNKVLQLDYNGLRALADRFAENNDVFTVRRTLGALVAPVGYDRWPAAAC